MTTFHFESRSPRKPEWARDQKQRHAGIMSNLKRHDDWHAIGGRVGGTIGGRINGPITGRRNAEIGLFKRICTREARAKGGRVQGRKNVKSGQIQTLAASGIGGRFSGRQNVESGQLAKARLSCNHTRWHVNRGIKKPDCKLCQGSL